MSLIRKAGITGQTRYTVLKFINNSRVIKPIACKHSVTRCCLDIAVKHRQTQHHKSLAAYVIKIFDVIFHPARFPLFLSGNIFNIPL